MSAPDAETQGGGPRGGPRRWTGKGPRPARHIPWPELFKHHQSVLTGHLKMMDMVRKHCVEGSGNHVTAQACVDRTHEMLRMFKKATATFIPPKDNLDKVPLGASSASMYPGYSPADHIYGEAASEFGKHVAGLKKMGIEFTTGLDGPEYDVGSEKRMAQEQTDELKRMREDQGEAEPMEGVEETDQGQLFVIDSNPTPVAFQADLATNLIKSKNKANDKAKRRNSNDDVVDAAEEVPKQKKVKMSVDSDSVDDFEAEVDAKHKMKEEKRKAKKEKKRKRESEPSDLAADVPVEGTKTEKPKKKKSKKDKTIEDDAEVRGEVKKRNKSSDGCADGEKKKKIKKTKESA